RVERGVGIELGLGEEPGVAAVGEAQLVAQLLDRLHELVVLADLLERRLGDRFLQVARDPLEPARAEVAHELVGLAALLALAVAAEPRHLRAQALHGVPLLAQLVPHLRHASDSVRSCALLRLGLEAQGRAKVLARRGSCPASSSAARGTGLGNHPALRRSFCASGPSGGQWPAGVGSASPPSPGPPTTSSPPPPAS